MFHSISFQSLYTDYKISDVNGISSSPNTDACDDNTEYNLEEEVTTKRFLDKKIILPFTLEKNFLDSGFYEKTNEDSFIEIEYEDNYFLTGETISRVDEVQTYDGQYIVGLNFNQGDKFTGIIEKNASYIHYVFDSDYINGNRIDGTGIEYFTFLNDNFSFLKYYPKANVRLTDSFFYKDDSTFYEYSEIKQEKTPFIDRTKYLEPMYYHEALTEINTLEDLNFSIFNIN